MPMIVMGTPYFVQGPGMPYAAPQARNNTTTIWILAIACCIFVFVIPGIIGVVIITNRKSVAVAGPCRRSCKAQTIVEGIIFGNRSGVFLVSLPSLEQKQISSQPADFVAFDWNSRKVYWINRSPGVTRRANLDGTGVEEFGSRTALGVYKLAVDWRTGNVYYLKSSPDSVKYDIRVCSNSGEICSTLAIKQPEADALALYPSESLMFWTNRSLTVRASMEGKYTQVIFSKPDVSYINVDEDSDRVYWIDHDHQKILSSNIFGNYVRVHLNDATGGLYGLAVHGDMIYFGNYTAERIQSVNKDGGNLNIIANTTGSVRDVALYGNKSYFGCTPCNPCASSPCKDLCVLSLDLYACLLVT